MDKEKEKKEETLEERIEFLEKRNSDLIVFQILCVFLFFPGIMAFIIVLFFQKDVGRIQQNNDNNVNSPSFKEQIERINSEQRNLFEMRDLVSKAEKRIFELELRQIRCDCGKK